jgi:hypothetical protein
MSSRSLIVLCGAARGDVRIGNYRKGSPAEYSAGLKLAIDRRWLWMYESGTYVMFTQAGAELFA